MTTTTKHVLEAATLVSAPDEAETWKVRLINEGRGSSGVYSRSLLENYGHAFNDSISFLNHPQGGPETRNFSEIVGRVVGETWLETADDGTLGVYANWKPDSDYRRKLTEYKDRLGLSIYIAGTGEVEDDGQFHVKEFDASDPFRSVDVVIAAGRGGRFEESLKKIYEDRNDAASEKPGATVAREERKLMDQEMKDTLAGIQNALNLLVTKEQTKAEEAAQVTADDEAVNQRVEAITAGLDAVEAARAELFPAQVESLRAEAKKGTDVAPLIEAARKVREEALEAVRVTESAPGRDFGGSAGDFKIGRWS